MTFISQWRSIGIQVMMTKYITVVETREFVNFAKQNLSEEEKKSLIDFLAENPKAGVLISGTGGLRKLRWARPHQGKSGSYRVIYYYHNENIPLFLISAFAKNVMENISEAAKNEYAKLLKELVRQYEGGNGKI